MNMYRNSELRHSTSVEISNNSCCNLLFFSLKKKMSVKRLNANYLSAALNYLKIILSLVLDTREKNKLTIGRVACVKMMRLA